MSERPVIEINESYCWDPYHARAIRTGWRITKRSDTTLQDLVHALQLLSFYGLDQAVTTNFVTDRGVSLPLYAAAYALHQGSTAFLKIFPRPAVAPLD